MGRFCKSTVFAIVAVASLAGGAATAADRVRMLDDNAVEISVKDCVKTAARAVADEDLATFVGCFTERQRPQLRRRAAILFATHTLDMELLDSHLLSESKTRAELAVKYRATLSGDSYEVVSILGLVNEDDAWRIAREKIESSTAQERQESSASTGGQVFRFGGGGDVVLNPQGDDLLPADIGRRRGGGCANGRCGL